MSIPGMCPCRGQVGGFSVVRMVPQKGCGSKNSKKSNKIKHLYYISAERLRIFPQ